MTTTVTLTEQQLAAVIADAVSRALQGNLETIEAPAPEEPKAKLVTNRRMAEFRKASGRRFQTAKAVADAVKAGKLELPEGWAFGPRYSHYVATGQFPES